MPRWPAHGRQGLEDLGLEPLLGLGFSLDGDGRSAHRPAADRGGSLAQGYSKNSYSIEGINGGWYLPGNGGLLYAVAMMAAGWDGAARQTGPGFPDDGSWVVKWEGLKKAP